MVAGEVAGALFERHSTSRP